MPRDELAYRASVADAKAHLAAEHRLNVIDELLGELQHSTEVMDYWKKDRDRVIKRLVAMGVSCRTIAQFTNMNYKTIYDKFYPNSKRRKS